MINVKVSDNFCKWKKTCYSTVSYFIASIYLLILVVVVVVEVVQSTFVQFSKQSHLKTPEKIFNVPMVKGNKLHVWKHTVMWE